MKVDCHNKTAFLTHWGLVSIICTINWDIIGLNNVLSPICYKANIWTNADLLSIVALGTNLNKISIKIIFIHKN